MACGTNCSRSAATGSWQAVGITSVRENIGPGHAGGDYATAAIARIAAGQPGRPFSTSATIGPGDAATEVPIGEIGTECDGAGRRPFRPLGTLQQIAQAALPDAPTFVGYKEEGAVLLDRPAECPAELVLVELRLDGIEVALRIQNLITKIFVNIAMKVIGARLGDHVDHGTRIAAVLGVEGIRDDAKLLDAVRRGLDGGEIYELIVGIAAVDAEVIGRECGRRLPKPSRLIEPKNKLPLRPNCGLHAGLQLQELISVTRVKR